MGNIVKKDFTKTEQRHEERSIKEGRQVKFVNVAKNNIDMIAEILLQPLSVDQTI